MRKIGMDRQRSTYISAADMVLRAGTYHLHRVTVLKRYEAEALLDALLAIERLLEQINLQKNGRISSYHKYKLLHALINCQNTLH